MSITTLIVEGEPRAHGGLQKFCKKRRDDTVLARTTASSASQSEVTSRRPNRNPVLVAERNRRFHFLRASAVDYLEVDGNYVTIHVGEDRYLLRATLKQLAAQLSRCDFIQVDRSCVVNLRRVDYVERLEGGQFAFTLRHGHRILSSRERSSSILRLLRTPIR